MRTLALCVGFCALLLDGRTAALHAPAGVAPAASVLVQNKPERAQGSGPQHQLGLALRGGQGDRESYVKPYEVFDDGLGEWGWRESKDRVFYRLQNIMLSTPFYKFVTIITSSSICIIFGAIIIKAVESAFGAENVASWSSALFTAYSLIADAPGADAVEVEDLPQKVSRNIIFFFGIFTFAIVLGIVTATIEQQVDYLMEANYRVMEKDHTVILNWSERTLPVLRQIAETRGYKALPVVIMANKDLEEMRGLVEEGLGDLKLNVQVRSGEPTSLADLEKVNLGYAKNVMILNPDGMDELTAKVQGVCASVLQKRCQPKKVSGQKPSDLHTVVVQAQKSDLPELLGYTPVRRSQMVQRAIAGSVAGHGLSAVFTDIFTAGDGAEIYVTDLDNWPWLEGKTFAELSNLFIDSAVLGWMTQEENGKWVTDMCPPAKEKAVKGMKLAVLADSAKVKVLKRPIKWEASGKAPDGKSCVSLARAQRVIKSVMVLNEQDTYLQERIAKSGDKVKTIPVNACQSISLVQLKSLNILSADVLVIKKFRDADGKVSPDTDAKAITACKMIALLRSQNNCKSPVHLVVSMHQVESVPLLQTVCANPGMTVEHLVTDEVEAGAMVQMLETPVLKPVYVSLLEAGTDLFLIPAHLMLPIGQSLSFGYIAEVAMNRKAVALGIRKADGGFLLSPRKKTKITLVEGDQIIVIADFE